MGLVCCNMGGGSQKQGANIWAIYTPFYKDCKRGARGLQILTTLNRYPSVHLTFQFLIHVILQYQGKQYP